MDLKKNFEFLSSANRIGDDIKTVDDLLTRDDINQILSETVKVKKDIKRMIVVWEDDQGVLDWRVSNMRMSKLIGMMEMVKMYAMMDNEYNECSEDD
jgi:hypothetical protein